MTRLAVRCLVSMLALETLAQETDTIPAIFQGFQEEFASIEHVQGHLTVRITNHYDIELQLDETLQPRVDLFTGPAGVPKVREHRIWQSGSFYRVDHDISGKSDLGYAFDGVNHQWHERTNDYLRVSQSISNPQHFDSKYAMLFAPFQFAFPFKSEPTTAPDFASEAVWSKNSEFARRIGTEVIGGYECTVLEVVHPGHTMADGQSISVIAYLSNSHHFFPIQVDTLLGADDYLFSRMEVDKVVPVDRADGSTYFTFDRLSTDYWHSMGTGKKMRTVEIINHIDDFQIDVPISREFFTFPFGVAKHYANLDDRSQDTYIPDDDELLGELIQGDSGVVAADISIPSATELSENTTPGTPPGKSGTLYEALAERKKGVGMTMIAVALFALGAIVTVGWLRARREEKE